MKFKYFKFPLNSKSELFGSSILKPIIPVEITRGSKTISYAALIDSGADFCLFDSGIAGLLGIDIRSGKVERFGGIQAVSPATAFIHELIITIGGWKYKVPVGFSYDIAPHGYGVLGQKGFFDIFVVKFDLAKEEIELKTRSPAE